MSALIGYGYFSGRENILDLCVGHILGGGTIGVHVVGSKAQLMIVLMYPSLKLKEIDKKMNCK